MPEIVLLTGCTGYIGAWICKTLVERGHTVRATVRKIKEKERFEYLHETCGDVDHTKIQFVEVDLESPVEKWVEALTGCTACIHTAGPVKFVSNNPQKEILDPILEGIDHIFNACHQVGIKKVVFTSSITAISDRFKEYKTHVYSGKDWNEDATLETRPYPYSKMMGEKAAHQFVQEHKSFSLACVLPNAVMGPMLPLTKPKALPETMEYMIARVLRGEMYLVNYDLGISDVRDVASIHVLAMEHLPDEPTTEVKRYLNPAGVTPFREILKSIREAAPEKKNNIPKVPIPNFLVLVWAKIAFAPGLYNYVSGNIGRKPKFDVSNVENELGIKTRPVSETIKDSVTWVKKVEKL